MTTPPTSALAITCPSCGAHFQVAGEVAGHKGRCAKCGTVFRVLSPAQKAARDAAPPQPQLVAVTCRVCQTLMYGRLDQVGQPLKCPDCGAQTVVPQPPPPPKPKQKPVEEGPEYELWGVDEAPSVAEMVAAQPKYIAVVCHTCQTLMHATESQVGKQLKCPDCGALNVVPPPEKPKPKRPAPASDEFDLEIDPSRDPGERPVLIPPRQPMLYEQEAEEARQRQEERHARGDRRGPQYDDKGHAVLPRWPLATRILPFLFSRGVPVRWLALSAGAIVSGGFVLGGLWMAFANPIGGMAFLAIGVIFGSVWLMAASSILITIVTESSEGNDQVEHWPGPQLGDWLGELFYILFACLASPLPGWLIGRVIPEDGPRVLLFMGSMFVCFPVILLSQLDASSAFAIASPRVIASLVRLPGTWLMFYIEIALLAAACVAATAAIAPQALLLTAVLVPLYIAALLLAARILGRLAWKLAETMPAKE